MLRHRLFQALVVLVAGLVLVLAQRHDQGWDWSADGRNRLQPATLKILAALQGPVEARLYLEDYPVQRAALGEVLEKFHRALPGFRYRFIDPAAHPAETRELGIARTPLLILRHRGREARLEAIDEQTLAQALARLSLQEGSWIGAITGHGEARLLGRANHDLGDFGRLLESQGYRILELDLTATEVLPDNLALLVLAAPAAALSATEAARLEKYLEGDGNLLWLADGPLSPALARTLELNFLPGTLVDAAAADLGLADPTVAVARPAGDHPVTADLKGPVLLPGARALRHQGVRWQAQPLLRSGPRSWNETGPLEGSIQRDPETGEVRGPLELALLLQRNRQQVAVVGDADFLSNAYLGNGANRAFGLALVHWLARNPRLARVPPAEAPDLRLHWQPATTAAVAGLFLVAIPALLALAGVLISWRRKRR